MCIYIYVANLCEFGYSPCIPCFLRYTLGILHMTNIRYVNNEYRGHCGVQNTIKPGKYIDIAQYCVPKNYVLHGHNTCVRDYGASSKILYRSILHLQLKGVPINHSSIYSPKYRVVA